MVGISCPVFRYLTNEVHFLKTFSIWNDDRIRLPQAKRFNSHFRRMLRQTIHTFLLNETQGQWRAETPCVALQMRRTDKLDSPSMDRCLNAYKQCKQRVDSGEDVSMHECRESINHDPRCMQDFSHTLAEYIDAVDRLVADNSHQLAQSAGQTLFVMSDDPDYVLTNRITHPNRHIYVMGGSQTHGGKFYQWKGGEPKGNTTIQTLKFFASLALVTRCQALVGNWGSYVSKFVYEVMCLHNRNICPPAVDMGRDPASPQGWLWKRLQPTAPP